MPVTLEEHLAAIGNPMQDALIEHGITPELLAKKLKEELNACEQKVFLDPKTRKLKYSKKMVAWKVRQAARIDAQRLRGDYPAEKVEHSGTLTMSLSDKLNKALERSHGGAGKTD